jgi:hypothetical protein
MKMVKNLLVVFLLVVGFNGFSQADTSKTVLITKQDGGQYTGVILSDDGREVLLDSREIGKIYIPKILIKKIESYDPNKGAEVEENISNKPPEVAITEVKPINPDDYKEMDYDNFMSTKYIQLDNAYPLRPGEAFMKFMPVGLEVQAPVSSRWMIGGMTSYIGAPLAIKTKYSIPFLDSSALSIDLTYGSMLFGSFYGYDARAGGGAASLTFSFGTRATNFSVKAGYALLHEHQESWQWDPITGQGFLLDNGDVQFHSGFISFSGMTSINKRTQFVFDLLVASGTGGSLITGAAAVRFGPKPRHRFQAGIAIIAYDDFFLPVPVPTLSYTFIFPKLK